MADPTEHPDCPHIVTGDEGTSYCDLAERRPWLEHSACDQRITDDGTRIAELEAEVARLRELLRRAFKNHDAISASFRAGTQHLFKAIDDMGVVKDQAREFDCYPAVSSALREPEP